MEAKEFRSPALPHRAPLAVAAVLVSLGSFASLLAQFDAASPRQWLQPTPQVMAQVSRCESSRDRAARDTCVRLVVAARLERLERLEHQMGEDRLASR